MTPELKIRGRVSTPRRHYRAWHESYVCTLLCERCGNEFETVAICSDCPTCREWSAAYWPGIVEPYMRASGS